MRTEFIDKILKIRPKLKGDNLRIILYLMSHSDAACSDIISGTGISKSHVSEGCSELCYMGILKRFEYTAFQKHRRVKYTINYNYKASKITFVKI